MKKAPNVDSVRYSNAGHDFHYTWAALRCLHLLRAETSLVAVTIEDASPYDESTTGDPQSLLMIDTASYYGSEDLSKATAVVYTQVKYATVNPNSPWTAAALTEKEGSAGTVKKPRGIIGRFADRYRECKPYISDQQVGQCDISFELVTNRPMSEEVNAAIRHFIDGTTPDDCEDVCAAYERMKEGVGLEGVELKEFAKRLILSDNEGSRFSTDRQLEVLTNAVLAGPDAKQAIQLKRMVADFALPERSRDPTIRRTTVLNALGIDDERKLLPCEPKFEPLDAVIPRDCEREIAERIVNASNHTMLQASGGVGKSVLAQRLERHFPPGSRTIVFDGFGGGSYRDPSQLRHTHERGLVHIMNELAARGLCWPIVPSPGWSPEVYLAAFREKLEGIAKELKAEERDGVIVIIVDAADNLAMAAQEQGHVSGSFVDGLLRMEPIDRLRFVVTCRPERAHLLDISSDFNKIDIPDFSIAETTAHIGSFFSSVSDAQIAEFHRLTMANPRVQANELTEGHEYFQDLLSALGPNPRSVEDVIERQLDTKLRRLQRAHAVDRIELFCVALAALPPRIPVNVLAIATGISENEVRSFAADFGKPLWFHSDAVQFRDEPTESWFYKRFSASSEALARLCEALLAPGNTDPYILAALPSLLFRSGLNKESIENGLRDEDIDDVSEVDRHRIQIQRAKFGLKAALLTKNRVASSKLLFLFADYVAHNLRWQDFVVKNALIFSYLGDPVDVQSYVFSKSPSEWKGRAHATSSAILSLREESSSEALMFLRQAFRWMSEWSRLPAEERAQEAVHDSDIVHLAIAILNLGGAQECVRDLEGWSPPTVGYDTAHAIATWLIDSGKTETLQEILGAAVDAPMIGLGVCAAADPPHVQFPGSALARLGEAAIARIEKPSNNTSSVWLGIVSLAEHLAWAGQKREAIAILEKFTPTIPSYIPGPGVGAECDQRDVLLRHSSLGSALKGQAFDLGMFEKTFLSGYEEHSSELHRLKDEFRNSFKFLSEFYVERSRLITNANAGAELQEAALALLKKSFPSELSYRSGWRYQGVRQRAAELWVQINVMLSGESQLALAYISNLLANDERKPFVPELTAILLRARYQERFHEDCLEICQEVEAILSNAHLHADEIAQSYVELARGLINVSEADAAYYLNRAVHALQGVGDEAIGRLQAVRSVFRQVPTGDASDELVYRFARMAEIIFDFNSHKFPWEEVSSELSTLSLPSALAIISRLHDRRIARIDETLPELLASAWQQEKIEATCFAAMLPIAERLPYRDSGSLLREIALGVSNSDALQFVTDDLTRDWDAGTVSHSASDLVAAIQAAGLIPDRALVRSCKAKDRNVDEEDLSPGASAESAAVNPETLVGPQGIESVEDFLEKRDKYRKAVKYSSISEFVALALKGIPLKDRETFLHALSEHSEITIFDLREVIDIAREEWRTSKVVNQFISDVAKSFVERNAYHVLFQEEAYMGAYYCRSLVELDEISSETCLDHLLSVASDRPEQLAADTAFSLAALCASFLQGADANHVGEFALSRFERLLNGSEADGPWTEGLKPAEEPSDGIAALIVVQLASPHAAERWRAAHTVVRLCRYGELRVLQRIVTRLVSGKVAPFCDAGLPLYLEHAKLWFAIALARAAVDVPGFLARVGPSLQDFCNDDRPHLLRLIYLRRAIERVAQTTQQAEFTSLAARLRERTSSPFEYFPQEAKRPSQKVGWANEADEDLRSDDDFRFGYDIDRYWFGRPSEAFGITTTNFMRRARRWLPEIGLENAVPTWKWDDDPRAVRGIYPNRSMYHSHGEIPNCDTVQTFCAFHTMFFTIGELLLERPLYESRYEDDPLQDILDRHLLARRDDYWLTDRRDLAPMTAPSLPREIDDELWRYSVARTDFDHALTEPDDPERIVLWGYWLESEGRRTQSVRVSSALVKPYAAAALLRALQTIPDPHSFKIPDAGEDLEIRFAPFSMVGWIVGRAQGYGIDEKDPMSGEVPPEGPVFSSAISRLLKLRTGEIRRDWYTVGDYEAPCAQSIVWGQWRTERDDYQRPHGYRLSAGRRWVRGALQKLKRDLIVEVQIERDGAKGKNYELDKAYSKIFLIRGDGSINEFS